jgi:hypothetical protein
MRAEMANGRFCGLKDIGGLALKLMPRTLDLNFASHLRISMRLNFEMFHLMAM